MVARTNIAKGYANPNLKERLCICIHPRVDLFIAIREMAKAEKRSWSNMAEVLLEKGLAAYVPK